MQNILDLLAHRIDYRLDTTSQTLARFVHEVQADPAAAFQWADNAMKAAAQQQVWKGIAAEFSKGATVEDLACMLRDNALKVAECSSSSTSSACSNVFQRFHVAAMAEAAHELLDVIS